MQFHPVDSPILTSALSAVGADHAASGNQSQEAVAQDRTFESRMATDTHDVRNIAMDFSNSGADQDFQKSVLATYNDGVGSIVNGYW